MYNDQLNVPASTSHSLNQSGIPMQSSLHNQNLNDNINTYSNGSSKNYIQTNSVNSNLTTDDLNAFDFINQINTSADNYSFTETNNIIQSNENLNLSSNSKKNNFSTKKRKKESDNESPNKKTKKKKKDYDPNAQFKRRNIKKIFTENKLNESTLKALEEEKRRQERLINSDLSPNVLNSISSGSYLPQINDIELKQENQTLLNESKNSSENKSSDGSIFIIEEENNNKQNIDDSDDIIIEKHIQKPKIQSIFAPNLIQIKDNENQNDDEDDDDDDCRLISESERQQDDEAKNKKRLRGIHMNDEFNVPNSNGQVLVNVNHPPEDADVYLLPFISKNVKPHQIGGIRFIYDNIVESLNRVKIKDSGFGCILAHAMGLGKTLQTISFVEVFLRCTGCKRVLCIVPINTIQNWLSEFNHWLPENGQHKIDNDTFINYSRPFKVLVINDFVKTFKQRIDNILNWKKNGGVLLIGYEMFRTLVTNTSENYSKKKSKVKKKKNDTKTEELIDIDEEENIEIRFQEAKEALLTPCLVVCDEGHRIKNNSANIAKTLQRIKTKRRMVLTGYPLQNNLIEYWCMVDFVRPNYLGTKAEFANMFERPIMNGQCIDSTREDVKLMRFRAHVLHSLLEGFVQRRGHDVFFSSLPKKQEYVILLKLSPIQKELYLAFMEAIGAMNQGEKSNPLRSFAICCKIWNHPDVLYKYNQQKENEIDLDLPELQQQQQNKTKPTSSTLTKTTYIASPSSSSHVILEDSGFNPFASLCNQMQNSMTKSSFNPDWANRLLESYKQGILLNGAKFHISFTLIEKSILVGDRILLFSQSLLSLNLIEEYLQKMYVPNTNQKWQKYKNYYRLDGSTTGVERERLINSFNQPNSPIWLFLLSTRAGCLGINLIGANRVIVLDASWNPCHDSQAVCRVFRYGQTKNCYIYRLIADHTMEKKIYDRQISKQTMSDRVVDEIQTENHFTRTEVEKLIHFVKEDVPCADLTNMDKKYNDEILINSCLKHANEITKEPFTHESLLIDKKEYQLSEREKAMAFRNYNHDKKYFPLIKSSSTSLLYQQMNYGSGYGGNGNHPSTSLLLPHYVNQQNFSSVNNNSNNNILHNTKNSYNLHENNLSNQKNNNENFHQNLDFNLNNNINETKNTLNGYLNINSEYNDDNSSSKNDINRQEICSSTCDSPSNPFQNLRDVKISSFVAPSKLVIPTSTGSTSQQPNEPTSSILIEPGEKVYIFKTQKGCYLRTQDKKFIALRNKTAEDCVKNLTVQSHLTKMPIDMTSNNNNNNINDEYQSVNLAQNVYFNGCQNIEKSNNFSQQNYSINNYNIIGNNLNMSYEYDNPHLNQTVSLNQNVGSQIIDNNNHANNNLNYNFNDYNESNNKNKNNNNTFLY